jgi:hypothetical protein
MEQGEYPVYKAEYNRRFGECSIRFHALYSDYYTPRINSETLIPNPFDKTSSIGRHMLFFPCSKSEIWPRSMPKR